MANDPEINQVIELLLLEQPKSKRAAERKKLLRQAARLPAPPKGLVVRVPKTAGQREAGIEKLITSLKPADRVKAKKWLRQFDLATKEVPDAEARYTMFVRHCRVYSIKTSTAA